MPAHPSTPSPDRLRGHPRSPEPTIRIDHPAMRPRPPSTTPAGPGHDADALQIQVPDLGMIKHHERVMAELLVAAQQERPKRLSRMAEEAVGGSLLGLTPASLTAVAVALRDRCVALGMPACRYREPDWRMRGMPMERDGSAV
jgi:hypothetical protein